MMQRLNDKGIPEREFRVLSDATRLLKLTELDAILRETLQIAGSAVQADENLLFIFEDSPASGLYPPLNQNSSPEIHILNEIPETGLIAWAYNNRQHDIIVDTQSDARWQMELNSREEMRSALIIPIIDDELVFGVLLLMHRNANSFSEDHIRIATLIADHASVAIRNTRVVDDLHVQKRQIQAIIQAMSDALLVLDDRANILIANPSALELLGRETLQDVVNQPLENFRMVDSVFDPILTTLESVYESSAEWRFGAQSQRFSRDYQVTMALWKDITDGMVGWVINLHDTTSLHDLSRFKDEMLRIASHDLRSPLALVAGYADMITMDTPDTESPIHDHVEIIKASVNRMGGLIDDLLRVERIRRSPLELNERIDLEALVKVVMVNMRLSAVARQQKITFDIQLADAPRMVADPVLLRQAMENLIGNAIKYTPEGGSISVRAYAQNGCFYFRVRDTGIGIAAEHLPHVFEAFYRVNSVRNVAKGNGLGLSLVKNVIVRHQGDVFVTSKEGSGSEFGFWLPLPKFTPTSD